MHIVLCSLFNLHALRKMGKGRVTVLIDGVTGVDGTEYARLLQPRRSWITVDAMMTLAGPLKPGALESLVSPACQVVVAISEQEDIIRSVRRECECLDLTYS